MSLAFLTGCSERRSPMNCEASLSLALQLSGLIVTIIFGLIGIMVALIKLSRKK